MQKLYDQIFELHTELRDVQKELRAQRECFSELNRQIEQLFNMVVEIQSICEEDQLRPGFQNLNLYER